jgi:hypothetical protein
MAATSASALRIGLVQGVLLGGLVGGIATARMVKVAWTTATTSRRRGLFLVRRPSRRRRCPVCAGFRIAPCDLCHARGVCDYRKRYARLIPCPRCTLRRYTRCDACGGSGLRELGLARRVAELAHLVYRVFSQAVVDGGLGQQAAAGPALLTAAMNAAMRGRDGGLPPTAPVSALVPAPGHVPLLRGDGGGMIAL